MTDAGLREPKLPPVDPTGRIRYALDRLGGAQKSAVGVPAYLRFVNRRLGGWLAALGYGIGLTPNHLTAISAALSAAAMVILCLAAPTVPVSLAITALLLAGYAFDSADGQLSRVRGDGTPAGEWLDHVVDVAKTAALHLAVLVSLARFASFGSNLWLLVPMGYAIVNVTFFFAMMLRDKLGGKPSAPAETTTTGPGSALRSLSLFPTDYGALCLAFLLLASPTAFMVVYGGLFVFLSAFAVRAFVRTHRMLAA